MSLSKPTTSSNPATKFIQFKKGKWVYYDKVAEEELELSTPFFFAILDQLHTVKGWSDQHQSSIYSNEIKNFNEKLHVRSFKGYIDIIGFYHDIKGEITIAGGRYCKSVYAMLFDKEGHRELVNFQLTGSSFGAFLEADIKDQTQVVEVTGETIPKKKGATEYVVPVFKKYKMSDEILKDGIEMDEVLQGYLDSYKNKDESVKVEQEALAQEADVKRDAVIDKLAEEWVEEDDPAETQLPF